MPGTSSSSQLEEGKDQESHADCLQESHADCLPQARKRNFCESFSPAPACRDCPATQPCIHDGSTAGADLQAHSEESDEEIDTSFFEVQALKNKTFQTQQDREAAMCEDLAKFLRRRPTLPADPSDPKRSYEEDLATGMALPGVSCSFADCTWHGDTDDALEDHVLNNHASRCRMACGDNEEIWYPVYLGAIASIERRRVPAVGLARDRQVLRKLTKHRYNDENICSLVCFVCGQIKTKTPSKNSHIGWQVPGWFASLPKASKTLDANCGWDHWCKQYGNKPPLNAYGPGRYEGAPQKEWCLEIDMCPASSF